MLIKGIIHKKESSVLTRHPEYKGDSHLLAFLIVKNGWSQKNVQNWAEPLFVVALGVLLATINLVWGIPIIFCALSIWAHQIFEYLFGHNQVDEKIRKSGYQNPDDDYMQIRY